MCLELEVLNQLHTFFPLQPVQRPAFDICSKYVCFCVAIADSLDCKRAEIALENLCHLMAFNALGTKLKFSPPDGRQKPQDPQTKDPRSEMRVARPSPEKKLLNNITRMGQKQGGGGMAKRRAEMEVAEQ